MSPFILEVPENGIATLTFNLQNKDVNLLTQEALMQLNEMLNLLKKRKDIKALLFQSAKKDIFIAGADIKEIEILDDEQSAYEIVRKAQMILGKFLILPFPTIAIIDGACLGGGFELALRCNFRLCTQHDSTKIGLPEVNIGVLPGFGGTQLLKKLIGVSKAIELILGGKIINGKKALKLGMVDACVPRGYLKFKIETFVAQILDKKSKKAILKRRHKKSLIERFAPFLIYKIAKKSVLIKTKGHYLAPLAIIELFRHTQKIPINEALNKEAQAFSKLVVTPVSKNLISLFFAVQSVKNEKPLFPKESLSDINIISVVGGGIMGSGIVWLFSKMNKIVRLKIRAIKQASLSLQNVARLFDALKKRNRLTSREIDQKMALISYGSSYECLKQSDLVVEAIIEDAKIKQKIYNELEMILQKDAIIASNTSSLSISMLAKELNNPKRFIGMHFFNPVSRMPLVEVIAGDKTDKQVIATVVELAKKAGKTAIIVKDCAGFLVNRILLPFINESAKMFEEGADIDYIDKVIETFGMPMGPFTLADEVGLDVGVKVAKVLYDNYGERMKISLLLQKISNKPKLLGRKSKKGFYIYDNKNKKVNLDMQAFQVKHQKFDVQEIIDRAILIMINEAALCLQEGIVKDSKHLDVAMVMGAGFPAFRGGLCKYADTLGLKNIYLTLENLTNKYGSRFKPAPLIASLAKENKTFYEGVIQ